MSAQQAYDLAEFNHRPCEHCRVHYTPSTYDEQESLEIIYCTACEQEIERMAAAEFLTAQLEEVAA